MNISKYFTLEEMIVTSRAVDNMPGPDQIDNLRELAGLLDELVDHLGHKPFEITSGFRSPALNASLGGASSTSQHMAGLAADLYPHGMSVWELFARIYNSPLRNSFSQIIVEEDQGIVHVGVATFTKRGQPMVKENGTYRELTYAEIGEHAGQEAADESESIEQVAVGNPARTIFIAVTLVSLAAYFILRERSA